MIKSQCFINLEELNKFVDENSVFVISISEEEESYYTGLPLPNGREHKGSRKILRVWFATDLRHVFNQNKM